MNKKKKQTKQEDFEIEYKEEQAGVTKQEPEALREDSDDDVEESESESEEEVETFEDLKPKEKHNTKKGLTSEESKNAFIRALNSILNEDLNGVTDVIMCKNSKTKKQLETMKKENTDAIKKQMNNQILRNKEHILPTLLEITRENELRSIAREGVVQLFKTASLAKKERKEKKKAETGYEVLEELYVKKKKKKKKKEKEEGFMEGSKESKKWDVLSNNYDPSKSTTNQKEEERPKKKRKK